MNSKRKGVSLIERLIVAATLFFRPSTEGPLSRACHTRLLGRWFQRTIIVLITPLLPSLGSTRARAQNKPVNPNVLDMSIEDLMSIDVDSVYGASGFKQKVTEAPASVTIVTSEEIQRYGCRTLADILRNVRGFYVTYDRNYSYLGVRGFGLPGEYNIASHC